LEEENTDKDNQVNKDKLDEEDRRVLEDIIYKKNNQTEKETEIFDLKTLVNLRQDRLWGGQ
jgi:adenylate cyclase